MPIAAVALAAALLAAPAAAKPVAPKPTLVDHRGQRISGAPMRWLRQSKMPLFDGRLKLILRACPARPQFSGCVYTRRPRRLYINPGAKNPRAVIYHEIGHSFDLLVLRTRHRRAFKRIAGLRRPGWFSGVSPRPSCSPRPTPCVPDSACGARRPRGWDTRALSTAIAPVDGGTAPSAV